MNNRNLILLAQRVKGFINYTDDDITLGKSILLAVQFFNNENDRDLRQEMNIRQAISEADEVD